MRRILLALLAACTSPNASLADLPNLTVIAETNRELDRNDDATAPVSISVRLEYDEDAFRMAHGGACAVVDLAGRFNDVALEVVNHGRNDEDHDSCHAPELETIVQLGARDATRLELGDDSLDIVAEYAAGVMGARIGTLLSHETWHFVSNDRVVLRWSHPEDFAVATDAARAWFSTAELVGFDAEQIETSGDELRFTIPPTGRTGGRFIDIGLGDGEDAFARGDAARCEGAARCWYRAFRGAKHAATVN